MKATTSPFRSNFYLWHGVSAIFFSNCLTNTHSQQYWCRSWSTSRTISGAG